ncbi:MAG: preprotein translocase subunit SecG [Verrucomicrobiota bacterium]
MLLTAIIVVLSLINVFSCVLMVLVVLMQRSKSDGIGASFGGGFTESMFGAQTSSVLVKTTRVLAIAFLLSATLLASSLSYQNKTRSAIQEQLQATESAPAATAPAPSTVSTNSAAVTVPAPTAPVVPSPAPTTPTPAKK